MLKLPTAGTFKIHFYIIIYMKNMQPEIAKLEKIKFIYRLDIGGARSYNQEKYEE